jgi:hypothetical protein
VFFIRKKSLLTLLLVFLLTEFILLCYLFETKQFLANITADGQLYMNLAVNLLSGNGLLNPLQAEGTIIPPLFPLLIVPFIGIFNTIYSFFVFQYILYGVNALILFYLTRKVFQEKTNACSWFAVLLYIFNPVLLKNGPQFLETGTVYTFFILMITWSLIDLYDSTMRKKGTNRAFIISIAAITLSLFLQPQMLFMLPIMLIVALILLRKRLLTGKSLLLSILIPVLLFGANMIHNHIIHGEPVMLDNVSGEQLYIANNPHANIEFSAGQNINDVVEPYYFTLDNLSLSEKNSILWERAIDFILSEPKLAVERMFEKGQLFFQDVNILDTAMNMLAVAGVVVALLAAQGRRGLLFLLLCFIAGYTVWCSMGPIVEGQKLRAPIIPLYLMFSAHCIHFVWNFASGMKKASKGQKPRDLKQ